ncbi:TPA: DNA helicase [Streptococcus suis]|nr:DNA helicase [Streptococcus suis]
MAVDNYIPKIGDSNRIDNKERTMRGAIGGLMAHSKKIRIASGYFRLSGVVELESDLRDYFSRSPENKIELLISNQYDTKNTDTRTVLGIAEGSVDYSAESFYLDNEFYQDLVEWIKSKRIEVKIFVDEKYYLTHSKKDIAFLHGKAYLFTSADEMISNSVLIGSSNFTFGGLVANRELNMITADSFPPIKEWFDEMWEEYSEPYSDELLEQFEEQKNNFSKPKISYTPVEYFYWNLGKYYGKKAPASLLARIKEIDKRLPYPKHSSGNKFFAHQTSGIKQIYTQLKAFDTQILADGVGLGKTLEAAAVVKLFQQDLNIENDKRRILILVNERLREQWVTELMNVGVELATIDMTTRQKFTNLTDEEIRSYGETYALVVIDEAHEGFLRKNNKAYRNMQKMLKHARLLQSREVRGLLLTATPWNNSREDVIRLGLLFLNIQKVPKERQYYQYLLNEREKMLYDTKDNGKYNQKAYREFWTDLYLQRTRNSLANEKFLSDRYPSREFPLEVGDKPFTITYSSEVSAALTEILERLIELKLPYQDTVWQYFGPNTESNVIMRQRFQLLRRADSSNAAFGRSLENIRTKLEIFHKEIASLTDESLAVVKKYFYAKINEEYAREVDEFDNRLDLDFTFEENVIELNKSQQDRIHFIDKKLSDQTLLATLKKILRDTENDIKSLDEILNQWKIVSQMDEKQKIVIQKVRELISRGDKVLLFSEFSDTVESYFKKMLEESSILKAGIGIIHGGVSRINHDDRSKQDVLGRFSPQSKSYELVDENEIAVLLGTDAISTGQNLQDANHIITIELPYNPMRLEQRIGRIDRPKSNGENTIYVYAFPSEEVIGAELKLSERFEGKAKGASIDTEGDFKLPFVHDGKYIGLLELQKEKKSDEELQHETLISSVSEDEARERVFAYYEQKGAELRLSKDYVLFPYSFVSEQSILMAQVSLHDINNRFVTKTEPILWNQNSAEVLEFVEVEKIIRDLIGAETYIDLEAASQIVAEQVEFQTQLKNLIADEYNANLKSVSELEVQPDFVSNLRRILDTGARGEYRNYLKKQGVNPKEFIDIVKSFNNRGFNKEQLTFLQNLKDSNGKMSSKKLSESIWNNLQRFVEIFKNTNSDYDLDISKRSSNKANKQTSQIEILSAILSVDK